MGNGNSLGSSSTADRVAQVSLGLEQNVFTSKKLEGKSFLITGANCGIGLEAARVLSNHGGRVVMACRSLEKAQEAINSLQSKENVSSIQLDLSSLKAVRDSVKSQNHLIPEKIDVLINNAGIMQTPEYTESADGFELQFATNHLGHFLLTDLLRERLSPDARVVNVSSHRHAWGKIDFERNMPPKKEFYNPSGNYGISKGSNILFARQLQKEFSLGKQTAYSLHPGVIPSTELFKNSPAISFLGRTVLAPFFKDIPQGAATTIYCAIHPDAPNHAGEFFRDCHVDKSNEECSSMQNAEKLWKLSKELVQAALLK
jgi:retinol dehydrogenase-12